MRTIPISAENNYQIEVDVDWRVSLADWTEGRKNVLVICSEHFPVDVDFPIIQIPDGEAGKSISSLQTIWQKCAENGLGRDDVIVAIGGGAITDVAGFAAATWLRGIDWIAIPTTLAGMVDASIGGKTAINSNAGKNLIGSFHSPKAVLMDTSWLKSLTPRDFAAGLAEVIKCGFIQDLHILELLKSKKLVDVIDNDELIVELIFRAANVKAEVVSQDFKESFKREILNYGHTLGHAIEKHSNYQLRHGEAISIGLCFAAELSHLKAGLNYESVSLHYELLEAMNLPTKYLANAWPDLEILMNSDKKNRNGQLRFVGLTAPGNCNRIENPNSMDLSQAYERIAL
ncbi:MAG: 3-dehydroquinate synthase [Candidatus Nanopelagicaceae bacterium]|jgi:3-dehydroquinate synthase